MTSAPQYLTAFTALVACVLLSVLNLIVAITNDWSGSLLYGTSTVIETVPEHLVFASLFWLSCLWKSPLRTSLR